MKLSFQGQKALIAGGSSDLGVCLAEKLINTGIHPILIHRSNKGLDKINATLLAYSDRYSTCSLDFSDPAFTDRLHEADLFADYVVDLAHGDYETLISGFDDKAFQDYMQANITARALFVKYITRKMLANRFGRLVFVSSTAANFPAKGQGVYAASKTASETVYKSVGIELGAKGITTVTLRPGYVAAGRGNSFLSTLAEPNTILKKIPIKRCLTPEEVSETLLFLLSDSALGFNATELTMDGGLTAGKSF